MLDHFGFVVKDLAIAAVFYENCFAPLGLSIIERHDYGAVIVAKSKTESIPFLWIGTARPCFWTETAAPSASPVHLCFKAPSKEAVDRFYRAGLAHGGADNGPPGDRRPGYYAAFVIDPDGNNIEACFRC